MILGVHLCAALSPKAVELFNVCAAATLLALKPSCRFGFQNHLWTTIGF
jgi:hypothetical protein